MRIKSATKQYQVLFKEELNFLDDFIHTDEKFFFVVDDNVWRLYRKWLSKINPSRLYILNAVEDNKTIDTALAICDRMTELSAKRNARLISIGGGITQDITGFTSNILYRGIKWDFIPTTLLAACDSCIGGKTSLNYKSYKNLLGTFYPPDSIYICPEFFKTLPNSDLLSGLGEIVKFNIMAGEEGLAYLEESLDKLLALDSHIIYRFVESSLRFKKSIIEEDEFDGGKRILLNFAHTFGHAFEVSSRFIIPHGTAVALGIIAANHVSNARGILDSDFVMRAESVISQIVPDYDCDLIKTDTVIDAIRKDKKQTGKTLTAVLLTSNSDLVIVRDLSEAEVRNACVHVIEWLTERHCN